MLVQGVEVEPTVAVGETADVPVAVVTVVALATWVDVRVGVGLPVAMGVVVATKQGGRVRRSATLALFLLPCTRTGCRGSPCRAARQLHFLHPLLSTCPYTRSNLFCPSYSLISKLTWPLPSLKSARHSMLKMRLGALPLIEVYTPHPVSQMKPVSRSSSRANMVYS